MLAPKRDASRDREMVVHRSQSVPMWDSSDPERAPPPLPINPGSPVTKPNISPKVQAVADKFGEKTRDNVAAPYTTNPMPPKPVSPEKSLIKGNYHKRMQSLQNADTRSEFINYLENKSPEKSLRASVLDPGPKIHEKANHKKLDDSPTEKPHNKPDDKPDDKLDNKPDHKEPERGREVPNFLINNRFLSKPILNEPTPPSATMLALQNMQLPGENDFMSRNKDSSSSVTGTSDSHHSNIESLSTQIHSLTDIASNLQREMAQLSRRSKDNATDLISLKAATNSRDEDIRKSLRELSSNLSSRFFEAEAPTKWDLPHFGGSDSGINLKEPEPSPTGKRGHSVPRMSSPNPFSSAMERELCGSPGPISDGSASIALLEKVLREMGTKEGQEKLLEAVDEIKSQSAPDDHDRDGDRTVINMLEEILHHVREDPGSRALVRSVAPADPFTGNNDRPRARSLDPEQVLAPDMEIMHDDGDHLVGQEPYNDATEEILDILHGVRTSVVEGGGMTNEVKVLVRELRGEVLGMGRDIARKLEEDELARSAEEEKPQPLGKKEITAIVDTSLADLKELLASTVNESRQSSSAFSEFRSSLNNGEPRGSELRRDDILEAIRHGWETYKPEIELQNFGLERDEILECLTEGLKSYQPQHGQGVTHDQVLAAVQEGMHNFQPPTITKDEIIQTIHKGLSNSGSAAAAEEKLSSIRDEILQVVTQSVTSQNALTKNTLDSGLGRDDILGAVSEGIESRFSAIKETQPHVTKEDVTNAVNDAFTAQHSALSTNTQGPVSRDDVLSAIAEGLENQGSMTREIELNKEDLMEAISSALHEATSSSNSDVGGQVLEKFNSVLGNMKDEFKRYSDTNGQLNENVLHAVNDGIDVVRKEVEGYAANAGETSGRDEIMGTVKEGFKLLQIDMEKLMSDAKVAKAPRNPNTPELLDAMEKEFEHLRHSITSMLRGSDLSSEKEEILDAINDVAQFQKCQPKKEDLMNAIREQFAGQPKTDDLVKAIKEEFESLREATSTTVTRAEPESKNDKDEIVAALRQSLEDLHGESVRSKDGEGSNSQVLDAFNDHVGSIRSDLAKVLDKPAAPDTSEGLAALKDGLNSLKADVEAIRMSQVAKEETEANHGKEVMLANESTKPDSPLEGLKIIISDLQAKVEAIEAAPRADPGPDALKKEHLDEVVAGLHELQSSVTGIVAQAPAPSEAVAKKEDTDAIETLVRNTKAQLDGLSFPPVDQIAKAEQFGALESVVKETKDAIGELSNRFESDGPTKSEIGTLESLLKDLWIAFDEFKGKDSNEDASEKVVKSDLQTVEAMIFEVKTQIEELKLPDVETLPTKTEIQELSTLVTEFRDRTAAGDEQASEARKSGHASISEKIDAAKDVVEGLGDELKGKLDGSSEGLTELKQALEGLTASAETFATVENTKELTELINREFDRARGEQDAGKLEMEERHAGVLVKHDEVRAAITQELGRKVDEKIGQIMTKYDDAQTSINAKFSAAEVRGNASLEAVTNTKALAEDVKLVIGSMGNTLNETCERISVDTKTFFDKVDGSYSKIENVQNTVKMSQLQARADLERTAAATDRVESQLHQFHPQVLESIQEILSTVGKQFDNSHKSVQDVKKDVSGLPASIVGALPPQEKYDDGPVREKLDNLLGHAENTQVQDTLEFLVDRVTNDQIHEKVDQLLSETTSTKGQVYDKLNELIGYATNGPVHDKLDTLIGHVTNTDQSVTQMMKLDEMHKDIMESSKRMNEMFAAQSAILAENNEHKRRESEEAAVALERRTAEKEQVEGDLSGLREEKESLLKMLDILKAEKDDLAKQNTKMSKELSGLETALELRREEMQVMEERADSLEKRILEGVLDHARSVLVNRPTRTNSKRARGTRARGPSASNGSKEARNLIGNSIGMSLKKRPSAAGSNAQGKDGKDRKIFSLSHVTGNRGSGDRQASAGSGITNLKRSHSVKSNMSHRKASWGVVNKENDAFPEEDGDVSETGTERRTSCTISKADNDMSDDDRDLDDLADHVDEETKRMVLYRRHQATDSGIGEEVSAE